MSDTMSNAKKGGFRITPKGHDEYMVYINMMNQVRSLGEVKVDWGDVDAIRNRVIDYFRIMSETNCRPTVAGLAMAFGISRYSLTEIRGGRECRTGMFKALTEEGRNEIKKAYEMLELLYESYCMNDDINPMIAIYMGTNHYGYRNASQVDVNTPALDKEREPSAEDIRLKYAEASGRLPSNTQEDNNE